MIFLFTLFVCVESFAVRKKPISNEEAFSKISGICVNTEYSGEKGTHPQKLVITFDGRFEEYVLATNTSLSNRGKYTIAESWLDSRVRIGNINSHSST